MKAFIVRHFRKYKEVSENIKKLANSDYGSEGFRFES
jgi:hypothetical protein